MLRTAEFIPLPSPPPLHLVDGGDPNAQRPTPKASLWSIQDEIDTIARAFDELEAGGQEEDVLAAIETYFGDLLTKRDEKVDAYCGLYRRFVHEADVCRAEAARIQKRATVRANRADRLKTRLYEFLKANEMNAISTGLNTVRRQSNGGTPPVQVDKGATLPPEFMRQPDPVPDLVAIAKALNAGYEIDGASFGAVGEHLRIE